MWHTYHSVTNLADAVTLLAEQGAKARIVAGATDLILELERGVRKDIDTLIDITRVPGLDEIALDADGWIHVGPLVTHNQCVASKLLRERALPLALACWEVGAPAIRNRGTVAGNVITGSPANDTITPLMALNAHVKLLSPRGERIVPLNEFYTGVRRTTMWPDEVLTNITFKALAANAHGGFYKLALRNAQAIAVLNAAVIVELDEAQVITKAHITLGAVAPTIIHAREAEEFLLDKTLTAEVIHEAGALARHAAKPIDDVRSSAEYRTEMVAVAVRRALTQIVDPASRRLPENPVLLWGKDNAQVAQPAEARKMTHQAEDVIATTINGQPYTLREASHKTLLRALRENADLNGTKEGCAEGECGACTVFLDGVAVMACLVPAPRAHGARITTIEGVEAEALQHAFVEAGAVQCGYCTPGLVMAAAKLLEENPRPTRAQAAEALTGNLCRCTGYYKILDAVLAASRS